MSDGISYSFSASLVVAIILSLRQILNSFYDDANSGMWVEPRSGASFFAEFSHVDGVCFQQYLDWFSQAYPKQLHLIQLDNGSWNIWSELNVPDNVILVFQPPYCPQVNPIERLWKEIKKHLKWELFDNLDRLRQKLSKVLSRLTCSTIASITGWDFILDALFVANI